MRIETFVKNKLQDVINYTKKITGLKPSFSDFSNNPTSLIKIDPIKLEVTFIHQKTGYSHTYSFNKILDNHNLLSNFLSDQAALIGYYFGENYAKCINERSYSITSFSFLYFPANASNYHIEMIDRYGKIIFSNNIETEKHTLLPIDIFNNKELINKFDSIQACYIGILSGIASTSFH